MTRGLIAMAKSFRPCQPAHFAQADMGRNIFAIYKFSACQRMILIRDSNSCLTIDLLGP